MTPFEVLKILLLAAQERAAVLTHKMAAGFWRTIDSDSVRTFEWFYYLPVISFAVLAVIFPDDFASVIEPVMGRDLYMFWVWVQIPAPIIALTGLGIRHGGTTIDKMTRPLLFRDWMGLFMQFGGHACMCMVLAAYVLRSIGTDGKLLYSAFLISSYVAGTFVLSLQCIRKLRRGAALHRELLS